MTVDDSYTPDEDLDTETDAKRFVRPRPPREPSQVYSVRIPVDLLERLRLLADTNHTTTSSLIRQWIVERLNDDQTTHPSMIDALIDRVTELEQTLTSQEKEFSALRSVVNDHVTQTQDSLANLMGSSPLSEAI